MKKAISVLATFFLIFGCDWKNQPENTRASASPTPSVLSSIKPTITPTKKPLIDTIQEQEEKLEYEKTHVKYNTSSYCKPKDTFEVKLNKPLSIAVKKDGSAIYVVNGQLKRSPNIFKYHDSFIYLYENMDLTTRKEIESTGILKITKNKEISKLETNRDDITSCKLDGNLDIDEENNIYILADNEIYKVFNEKYVEKVIDTSKIMNSLSILKFDSFYRDKKNFYLTFGSSSGGYLPRAFKDGLLKFDSNIFVNEINFSMAVKGSDQITIKNDVAYQLISDDYDAYQTIKQFYYPKINREDIYLYDRYSIYKANLNNLLKLKMESSNPNMFYNIPEYSLFSYFSTPESIAPDIKIGSKNNKYFKDFSNIEINAFTTKLLLNSKNDLYINNLALNQIWKITNDKKWILVAGSGNEGFKDGKGKEAEFSYPTDMTFDQDDNLYVADTGNNAIRKITPDGVVSTFYAEK